MQWTTVFAALLCLCLNASVAQGGVVYDISMNTEPLIGHAAGPFSLEFQLNDGSATGDGNNTANLTGFLFEGGTAVGSPTLTGGVSGNLTSGITLTDSGFFNQFIQSFMPGSSLSFRLSLSTNVDSGGTPDQFSFAILDKTGAELPTLAPSFFDVLAYIDIDSTDPSIRTFGTDTSRLPSGGGSSIDISGPIATTVNTPEPASFILLSMPVVVLSMYKSGVMRSEKNTHRQKSKCI